MEKIQPRIYLAARYSRFEEMQGYAAELRDHGFIVTSRWILGDHDIRAFGNSSSDTYMSLWAKEDIQDLLTADICVSFTEEPGDIPGRGRGGRHVEFGIAYAMRKQLVVVGPRENVFHWLPSVYIFPTWEEALQSLVSRNIP